MLLLSPCTDVSQFARTGSVWCSREQVNVDVFMDFRGKYLIIYLNLEET